MNVKKRLQWPKITFHQVKLHTLFIEIMFVLRPNRNENNNNNNKIECNITYNDLCHRSPMTVYRHLNETVIMHHFLATHSFKCKINGKNKMYENDIYKINTNILCMEWNKWIDSEIKKKKWILLTMWKYILCCNFNEMKVNISNWIKDKMPRATAILLQK